ncbi:toll/interleukin-1 receptor domain-containing protein [Crocosphaera sp.]|uniref:toll/interleukin-1 receptor domain-containing protein n=1 Tax=Crocosphaera sp. TaxID=2729996 RepID=UPI002635409A|nr:toll/interleukin-1 receptor domain-containing protein [Crocosphaera sp.]MDJ0581126.1 toll/interleukin-1 receptor domain-containing protein [Crocosphaera sp.]
MNTEKIPQIFIAHASQDKRLVRELYNKLVEAGYKPWLDEEDLLPGQNWKDEIPKALKNSDLFIACLSSTSISKRGYIQREFKMAMERWAELPPGEIYIIPLKFDDCEIPELRQSEYGLNLRDLQWLDYSKPNGFEKLIKAIKSQVANQESLFEKLSQLSQKELEKLIFHLKVPASEISKTEENITSFLNWANLSANRSVLGELEEKLNNLLSTNIREGRFLYKHSDMFIFWSFEPLGWHTLPFYMNNFPLNMTEETFNDIEYMSDWKAVHAETEKLYTRFIEFYEYMERSKYSEDYVERAASLFRFIESEFNKSCNNFKKLDTLSHIFGELPTEDNMNCLNVLLFLPIITPCVQRSFGIRNCDQQYFDDIMSLMYNVKMWLARSLHTADLALLHYFEYHKKRKKRNNRS